MSTTSLLATTTTTTIYTKIVVVVVLALRLLLQLLLPLLFLDVVVAVSLHYNYSYLSGPTTTPKRRALISEVVAARKNDHPAVKSVFSILQIFRESNFFLKS